MLILNCFFKITRNLNSLKIKCLSGKSDRLLGLLTHAGRAVPPGRAPFRAPPTEGFFDALTADGEIVRVPEETQKSAPADRTSNQSRGSGSGGRTRNFEPPKLDHRTRDGAGDLIAGNEIPKNGAERNLAIESWTRVELEEAADALEQSIPARQAEQIRLGETSVGPEGQQKGATHRDRIEQEVDLLRAIRKKLSES